MGFVRRKWFWIPLVILLLLAFIFSFFNAGGDEGENDVPSGRVTPVVRSIDAGVS